ncbi:hypothetical protein CC86DRAFT_463620 [Ophiobolus disseminans]|uniref:Uncharacterized protein n=1 Tax=Ophiobolus disseminans TaxID=1469910 RepID=A0A6A7AAP5_9PLEO|nr:hypothetical protein CC86DRAFT_463620 [Ophiobolus disseminans]
MAPKKRKAAPAKKRAETPGDNRRPPRNLPRLGFEHAEAYEDGSRGPIILYTWETIVKYVTKRVKQIRENNDLEDLHRHIYDIAPLQQEAEDAEQAYGDAKEAERMARTRVGFSPATKAAKAARDVARDKLKRVQSLMKSNAFNRATRKNDHELLQGVEQRLEDFLYYQETIRRWKRHRAVDPNERAKYEAERLARKESYKLETGGEDGGHFDWLHSLLEHFDSHSIGDQRYKHGWRDRLGNPITGPQPPVVGWEDLHLWTPRLRRWPVGLPRPIKVNKGEGMDDGEDRFEYDYTHEAGEILEPATVAFDYRGIEARRREVEDRPLEPPESIALGYKSHSERRELELGRFRGDRPNTSGFRPSRDAKGFTLEDRWRMIRTAQGLFIAAKESSWDWLTSYDCLDKVPPGHAQSEFTESAEREEPSHILDDPMIQDCEDYDEEDDVDLLETPTDENPPDHIEGEEPPNRSHLKRRANIDYPYPKKDFVLAGPKEDAVDKGKKRTRVGNSTGDEKRTKREGPTIAVTPWAEETDGRREWHVYRQLSPVSSVDSPPRSPIFESVVELENVESIPGMREGADTNGVWRTVSDSDIPPLELNRRRCMSEEKEQVQDPEQTPAPSKPRCKTSHCRAWWYHPVEECWVVHSKNTQRSADDMTEAQLRPIGSPQIQTIPESSVRIYTERLHDHYGVRQPEGQVERWPRLGVRVPYEPRTYDDRKVDPERPESDDGKGDDVAKGGPANLIAKDARKRATFTMRTLDVPIIKRAQEDWGIVDKESPSAPRSKAAQGGDGVGDDEESDDEHDAFRNSYLECSFPGGGLPAPTAADEPQALTDDPTLEF